MLSIFTKLADLITYGLFQMDPQNRWAGGLHFFIEDVSKIYVLILVMIYLIGLLRAGIDTEFVRDYLIGKKRWLAYLLATLFGAFTPFCSCSSIPLFLGFTSAGIPLGITMAFLITSPMINEVAVVMLGSKLGIPFLIIYVAVGMLAGIIGGFFIDAIGAERYLTPLGKKARETGVQGVFEKQKLTFSDRHDFARDETLEIFARVWKWILLGVGLGAMLHQFVPEEFITTHLGDGQWWSVPLAVFMGIPLYANASGVIPVAEALLDKGLPLGTTLAFMMSTVAASFPEFMMLKKLMQPKLLVIFFLMLLVFFTLAGWGFNILNLAELI